MTPLLILLCCDVTTPASPGHTPSTIPPADDAAAAAARVACVILVGSVVETISMALATPGLAAEVDAFVDDVSAGVWVVVNAAVTLAAVVTIFEHIVDPSMDGVQNVFSLSALGEETSTYQMKEIKRRVRTM